MEGVYGILFGQYQMWLSEYSNALVVTPKDDLTAKYNWLKSSQRDARMGPLSTTNRRVLILSAGTYTISHTLVLDTSFVDIASLSGTPANTTIIRSGGGSTVRQTTNDIRLYNFTIKNTGVNSEDHSFAINTPDNSPSRYGFMHFRQPNAVRVIDAAQGIFSVCGTSDIKGTWSFCEGDDYAWRPVAYKVLGATMVHCMGGKASFGGDETDVLITGTFMDCRAGDESFGGCASIGCNISSEALFQDCVAGNKSYGLGKEFAGRAIRCVGGYMCFAGIALAPYYAIFSGYAEDCVAGDKSFGSGHANCKNTGQLLRCKMTSMTAPMYCEAATIKESYLQVTGTDKHCIALKDDNTKLYNNTLIATGAGNSIYASAAKNVLALHCRMNKDKHANVTNLIGDGSLAAGLCIVNDNIV